MKSLLPAVLLGFFLCTQAQAFEVNGALPYPWERTYDEIREDLLSVGDQLVEEKGDLLVVRSHSDRDLRVAYLFSSGMLCAVSSTKTSHSADYSWVLSTMGVEDNGSPDKVEPLMSKMGVPGYEFTWRQGVQMKRNRFFPVSVVTQDDEQTRWDLVADELVVDVDLCPTADFADDLLENYE